MKLWGGRFEGATDAGFEAFSGSFAVDRRLAAAEITGTRAHVQGLARAGVLSAAEADALRRALDQLAADLRSRPPEDAPGVEDVHTWVAERLLALAGDSARKLQTGRSRNEQVALDLRLYLKSARPALEGGLGRMLAALATFAETHAEVLIPGFTHLQRAQPVSLGHHALAYAEMLLRDAGRIADAYQRMDVSPLGSGALAGCAWPTDRGAAAKEMGFAGVTQNSLDAVSDRDFAIELVFALSLMGVHLSRWAEDWILYSSTEFGWLKLGDAYATGSSLMPQKKNPDALELIRARSARGIGALQGLLVLLKGLPLAYNRDLQEDKAPVFEALDNAVACLEIAAGVVASTGVDAAVCARAANDVSLLATDIADLLVAAGVDFHSAHQQVGALVAAATAGRRELREFADSELKAIAPHLDPAQLRGLTAAAAVARRDCIGGTAVGQVRQQAVRVAAQASRALQAGRDNRKR